MPSLLAKSIFDTLKKKKKILLTSLTYRYLVKWNSCLYIHLHLVMTKFSLELSMWKLPIVQLLFLFLFFFEKFSRLYISRLNTVGFFIVRFFSILFCIVLFFSLCHKSLTKYEIYNLLVIIFTVFVCWPFHAQTNT